MLESCRDLEVFLRGEVDPARFPHREHVRMGFEMLRRHDFPETALRYSAALREMATRAGKPQAFHQTLTIAFLSLIAERIECGEYCDFASFEKTNPDLIDKSAIARLYTAERLATEASRRTFLLPVMPTATHAAEGSFSGQEDPLVSTPKPNLVRVSQPFDGGER